MCRRVLRLIFELSGQPASRTWWGGECSLWSYLLWRNMAAASLFGTSANYRYLIRHARYYLCRRAMHCTRASLSFITGGCGKTRRNGGLGGRGATRAAFLQRLDCTPGRGVHKRPSSWRQNAHCISQFASSRRATKHAHEHGASICTALAAMRAAAKACSMEGQHYRANMDYQNHAYARRRQRISRQREDTSSLGL